MRLVLYSYWRSGSSHRVRLALALKKLTFETVAINLLKDEQSTAEHLQRSPMGYVPCLVIDGEPFVESVAIIELLDDLFPTPRLYPADPKARARVRAMVEVINSGTQPLQNLRVLREVSSEQERRTSFARAFNERGLAAFERLMTEGTRYSAGDEPSAADCFLLPQYLSAKRFGADLQKTPRVVEVAERLLALPEAAAASPEAQPDAPR